MAKLIGSLVGLLAPWSLAFGALAQTTTTCPQPPPPPAPIELKPLAAKPALPPCVNPRTMIGNCRKPVTDRYEAETLAFNRAIDEFNHDSRAHADALDDWMKSTRRYAECEIDRMNSFIPK